MKKITVVLTGTGIYGYCGIALMEFFHEHEIRPNRIIGCSDGALVGAMWARGFSTEETLEKLLESHKINQNTKIDLSTALSLFKHPFNKYSKSKALLNPVKIQNFYHELFKEQQIEHLPIETILQTTNVQTASSHYIHKGLLADALYATSAVLPFYPAIEIEKKWLVNGSFSEYLPIDFLLKSESDVIIIMDPEIPITPVDHSIMIYYAQFVQKALRKASSPRTILMHDLHHSEIIMIPVKLDNIRDNSFNNQIKNLISASRLSISKKEDTILSSIVY